MKVTAALTILLALVASVYSAHLSDGYTNATCMKNGRVKFEVVLPSNQKYVEIFVAKNEGHPFVAKAIQNTERKLGNGNSNYRRIVGGFKKGDMIMYRFYSYLPNSPGRFTPGPMEMKYIKFSCDDEDMMM
mmetsp:Transcript_6183/g.18654  ORF Transcript_6183/g.18654 Transcript_6183/m.18654 type:complete len:131 (-) Transcript_6183:198-590(-)|eukprot:CAMPEP_0198722240 /NCGR_PEP_ID=MMETSP1475-20131203/31_1 /TAXON_ID= ORGANISM="Unidentified sp., Strain CCMP1999" /NCGR_SAMPLE_ID=MMETSP1475 /ASSEMBLY_ACC=CAM_ASM_001111 /LENGTH=130 /DNA_ID=CAMNT_0044483137 /DNA_START=110 /DNA_END=502 /DNA_ORIENTATION=-